jgi:hypothetical protein
LAVSVYKDDTIEEATVIDGAFVKIIVTRSDGTDGAIVVMVETDFEPDGSDGGPGLRVLINDDSAFVGVPFTADSASQPAGPSSLGEPSDERSR